MSFCDRQESKLGEYIVFPVVYTFKIVMSNNPSTVADVDGIFVKYVDRTVVTTPSSSDKYISFSITTELKDYEELKSLYEKISKLEGIKFYV